jgi:hypothetical protein
VTKSIEQETSHEEEECINLEAPAHRPDVTLARVAGGAPAIEYVVIVPSMNSIGTQVPN